jgi:hypothetical protein
VECNVSNEELLIDINNTEKELDAYYNIQCGFLVLANLPENEGAMSLKYFSLRSDYFHLYNECSNFLQTLLELKKERGL